MTNLNNKQNYTFPLIIMMLLFFLLGFFTIMSNSMIEFLKEGFTLSSFQSQFVNMAFYGAYLLSIPAGYVISKLGYRKGVIIGMLVITFGVGLFLPAIGPRFTLFMFPFFLIGLGDVFLNVAVNPYILALGPKETAASRLNLAGGLNSFATVIAPLFVSALIVDSASLTSTKLGANHNAQLPQTIVYALDKVKNEKTNKEKVIDSTVIYPAINIAVNKAIDTLKNSNISAEIAIKNAFSLPATTIYSLDPNSKFYSIKAITKVTNEIQKRRDFENTGKLSAIFIEADKIHTQMIKSGIFWPAIGAASFALLIAFILMFLKLPEVTAEEEVKDSSAPVKTSVWQYNQVTFGLVAIAMYVTVEVGIPSFLMFYYDEIKASMVMPEWLSFLGTGKTSMLAIYWSGLMIGRFMGSWLNTVFNPAKLLTAFAVISALLVLGSLLTTGNVSFVLMLVIGLFHSIMWPNINDIGLSGLGSLAKKASGILCTGVAGAAILTLVMGKIADITHSYAAAYSLLFVCYGYIIFYSIRGPKMVKNA